MELQSIRNALEKLVEPEKILVFEEVSSTMDEVRNFDVSKQGPSFKGVVVSLSQTSGRGRQGRSWISKRGDGVYLSAIFKVQLEDQSLFGILPLLVGLKLKENLESASPEIKLKWPNDIVVETERGIRKLAGLLLEATHDGKFSIVTIGVGINLKKIEVENSISLEELNSQAWSAANISALVLDSAIQAVSAVKSNEIEKFIAQYNSSMIYLDQKITFIEGEGRSVSGVNRGISSDGSLLLETSQGISRLYSGDVHQGLMSNE